MGRIRLEDTYDENYHSDQCVISFSGQKYDKWDSESEEKQDRNGECQSDAPISIVFRLISQKYLDEYKSDQTEKDEIG